MPKFYKPGKAEPKREKAQYGASITFERSEVDAKRLKDFQSQDELFWLTKQKACDIGYSVTVTGNGKSVPSYTGKVYAQWADMKDGGYSLAVIGCSSPFEAESCVLSILLHQRYRLDTIPESDVEF